MGQLKEIAGQGMIELQLNDQISNTEQLKEILFARYSGLQDKTYHIAVNQDIARQPAPLKNGDEIVLMPPFSGG